MTSEIWLWDRGLSFASSWRVGKHTRRAHIVLFKSMQFPSNEMRRWNSKLFVSYPISICVQLDGSKLWTPLHLPQNYYINKITNLRLYSFFLLWCKSYYYWQNNVTIYLCIFCSHTKKHVNMSSIEYCWSSKRLYGFRDYRTEYSAVPRANQTGAIF